MSERCDVCEYGGPAEELHHTGIMLRVCSKLPAGVWAFVRFGGCPDWKPTDAFVEECMEYGAFRAWKVGSEDADKWLAMYRDAINYIYGNQLANVERRS